MAPVSGQLALGMEARVNIAGEQILARLDEFNMA